MRKLIVLISVLVGVVCPLAADEQYCQITPMHTLCKYKGIGPACKSFLDNGIQESEKTTILETHNQYRQQVARGQERRGSPGPQPPAADMRELEWDDELASVAQRLTDQCVFQHDCGDCRRVSRFGVGQNVFISGESYENPKPDWKMTVKGWYDEVTQFSSANIRPFRFVNSVGHYTSLVWASTHKIGCGWTYYRDSRFFRKLYVCNYGPAGNIIQDKIYTLGKSCSACPSGTNCSKTYPGLCAEPVTRYTPKWWRRYRPLQAEQYTKYRRAIAGFQESASDKDMMPGEPKSTTSAPAPSPPPQTPATSPTPSTTPQPSFSPITTPNSTSIVFPTYKPATIPPIISCTFDGDDCMLSHYGAMWKAKHEAGSGYFFQTTVEPGKDTYFYISNYIRRPHGDTACVTFSYKKSTLGPAEKVPLKVIALPKLGKPGEVHIPVDSPQDAWVRAEVSFFNLKTPFMLMFKLEVPESGTFGRTTVALDQIVVRDDRCPRMK